MLKCSDLDTKVEKILCVEAAHVMQKYHHWSSTNRWERSSLKPRSLKCCSWWVESLINKVWGNYRSAVSGRGEISRKNHPPSPTCGNALCCPKGLNSILNHSLSNPNFRLKSLFFSLNVAGTRFIKIFDNCYRMREGGEGAFLSSYSSKLSKFSWSINLRSCRICYSDECTLPTAISSLYYQSEMLIVGIFKFSSPPPAYFRPQHTHSIWTCRVTHSIIMR